MSERELTAEAILAQVVRDLTEHDWPTENTWRDVFKVLGRPPMKPLDPGKPVEALRAAMIAAQEQKP